jgi:hypothetical protein
MAAGTEPTWQPDARCASGRRPACAAQQTSNRKETIMTTFTISTDNNITAFPTPEAAQDTLALGAMAFTSQKDLAKLAAGLAHRTPGGDLERLRRRGAVWRSQASQEVLGPQDGGHAHLAGGAETGARRAPGGPTLRRRPSGRVRRPPPQPPRLRRARAARRPSSWTCYAARTARPWPRSPRLRTGRSTASGASSAGPSPRRWGSRSRAPRVRMASAGTTWRSSSRQPQQPPGSGRLL